MAKKYLDPSGTQYNISEAKQRLASLSQSISALAGVVGDITAEVESLEEGLKPVAFSGSYNDLTDKTMTGYTKPASTSAIATTDTINQAFGKLEKGLDDVNTTIGDINTVLEEVL